MRPITLDDVLPLDEYACRRAELFREHVRYVDRCRRVQIGPELTLIFENRRTLWFKVQELLRVTQIDDPVWVERELAWYNRLLPSPRRLQAALLISIPNGRPEELSFFRGLEQGAVCMRLDEEALTALTGRIITSRPQDRRVAATAHWVEFDLSPEERAVLSDPARTLRVQVEHRDFRGESPVLTPELRRSILDEL